MSKLKEVIKAETGQKKRGVGSWEQAVAWVGRGGIISDADNGWLRKTQTSVSI